MVITGSMVIGGGMDIGAKIAMGFCFLLSGFSPLAMIGS